MQQESLLFLQSNSRPKSNIGDGSRSRDRKGSVASEHSAAETHPLGRRGRNSGRGIFETHDFDIGAKNDVISLSVDLKETEKNSYRIDFLKFREGMARSASVGRVFAMQIRTVTRKNRAMDDVMIIPTAVFDDLVRMAHEVQRHS